MALAITVLLEQVCYISKHNEVILYVHECGLINGLYCERNQPQLVIQVQ